MFASISPNPKSKFKCFKFNDFCSSIDANQQTKSFQSFFECDCFEEIDLDGTISLYLVSGRIPRNRRCAFKLNSIAQIRLCTPLRHHFIQLLHRYCDDSQKIQVCKQIWAICEHLFVDRFTPSQKWMSQKSKGNDATDFALSKSAIYLSNQFADCEYWYAIVVYIRSLTDRWLIYFHFSMIQLPMRLQHVTRKVSVFDFFYFAFAFRFYNF